MAAPEWKPDDRPSARKLNELGDSVNAALDPSLGQNPPPHPPTLIAIFELTEDITYPDSGDMTFPGGWTVPPDVPYAENCKKIWLKNATNTYITSGSEEETVYFPTITEFTQGFPPEFVAGSRVAAVWNAQSGRWECVSSGERVVHFELKDDLPASPIASVAPGQQATAYIQTWNGSAWVTDTAVEFEVFDKLGVYRGRSKLHGYAPPHDFGSYGTARFVEDADRWEVVSMTPNALMIRAKADESSGWSGSTITVDAIVVMEPSGAILTNADPSSTMTVYNFFLSSGENNADIVAVWDEDAVHWKIMRDKAESQPLMLEATVDESLGVAHTDPTFAVDNVHVMQPIGAHFAATSIASVRNALGFPAANSAPVLLFWNQHDSEWDAIPKPPLELIDPVTGIDYIAGTTHEFRLKKTRNTLVWSADAEDTNWDDESDQLWHATVEDKMVVSLNRSTTALQYKEETFHVLELGDTPTDQVWETLTTMSPVTDLEYDTASHAFREKTTQFLAIDEKAESAFSAWFTTVTDSLVIDCSVSGVTFEQQKTTLRVLEAGSDGSATPYHTGGNC